VLRVKDEEAKRELEEARRDLESKINDMKNDVQNMEAKYKDEKKQVDKRWQEMLDSARRERDETEKRSAASIAQAETNVAHQQERLNDLMNQMRIDRDHAQRERNNMQQHLANASRRRSSFCIVQ
jgi:Skp family chaperone for outer membrane proteins